jgi:hypothetical protein
LEKLEDTGDIDGAGEDIRENMKSSAQASLGYDESKHRKPWFDKEYSELSDGMKKDKLQCLQGPSEAN